MASEEHSAQFQSTLAPLMEQFVEEKRACGYKYREGGRMLRSLDRFLCTEGLTTAELPRSVVRKWLAKRSHESTTTQLHRFSNVRQFAMFAVRLGCPAYVPDSALIPRYPSHFVPRILTHEEIQKLLHAVDKLVPTARSPLRHLIMPEVFRLLYVLSPTLFDSVFPGLFGAVVVGWCRSGFEQDSEEESPLTATTSCQGASGRDTARRDAPRGITSFVGATGARQGGRCAGIRRRR